MPEQSTRPLILLSTYFPYGSGEVFLENELSVLADHFSQVYLLPMLPYGEQRPLDERVTLLNPSPPSCSKSADFLRGLTSRGFISEWRKSPGFPLSFAQLYLVARTLGIARRIEQRILQTVADYGLRDGIVYAYWMSQSCLGGVHAADKLGWPLVSRAHGGDLYTERYPGNYLPWQETKIRGTSRIFTVSEDGSRYLTDRYPDIGNRFSVSRLGVADRGVTPHTPGSGDALHLVSCSTVLSLKRVDLIYKTVTELGRRHPERTIRWTHFGDGPGFAAIETDRAQATLAPRNVQINLAGRAPNDAIIQYYQQEQADLFINYSTTEGVPVSIMEAFSCGIPAVAPDVGGISELIEPQTGLLFHANDSPEKVATLISGLWTEGKLPSMGIEARSMWASQYDRDENYRKFALELMGVQR